MVLPQGAALLYAPLEINLSKGAAFEPTSFAPDVWYGVTSGFNIGLIHSTYGTTGFYGIEGRHVLSGQGAGLCFTAEGGGCPKVYNNVGVVGRYAFVDGPVGLTADGGLFFNTFDPFSLALRLGLVASLSHGPVSASLTPAVMVGLAGRDPDPMAGNLIGNKTWFYLPFTFSYMITAQLEVMAQKGVAFPIGNVGTGGFGDLWSIPLTIGASYAIQPTLTLGAAFSQPVLLGGDLYDVAGVAGVNGRTGTVFVRWRIGDDTPSHSDTPPKGGH